MSRTYHFTLAIVLLVLGLILPSSTPAQGPPATGTPPFGSYSGGPEVINLANLNAHWDVSVRNKAGRGTNFTYDLSYDSSVWYPAGATWQPVASWGWRAITEASTGYITYATASVKACFFETQWEYWTKYYAWQYHDPFGVSHVFPGAVFTGAPDCRSQPYSETVTTTDGSGYVLNANADPSGSLYAPNGTLINAPLQSGTGNGSFTDRNGNELTISSGVFTDTLGTTALTVTGSGTPSSPYVFTYTAPSAASAKYQMKFTTLSIRTNFGCSGITDYGTNGTTTANLVSEIDLPDWNSSTNPNSRYVFNYEGTPGHSGFYTGRLASVTLPTGGTIYYAYSGGGSGVNGIICADGSAATVTRTTPDGAWIYAHSESGTAWNTLITDPQNNQTNINFQGIYETQRQMYQGSTSGTLLRQWTTCYNGNTSSCNTTAVTQPITQRNVTDQYGSSGLECQHNYFYNSNGGLTEQDDYDYGSGSPGGLLRKTLVTYASLGNITAFRQTVTICNGIGSSSSCQGASGSSTGTVIAQTNYNYDEANTLTSTSGIAQHTSVSGSRGNLTSVNYPVSGLTSHSTYYDTGSPNTSKDVNGATTTYNYSNNTADCQMAFATSISEPLSLSRSMTWNCTGGVMTQVTDENGRTVTTAYANDNYYWRPDSVTDQTGAQTNFCYAALTSTGCPTTPSDTQVETYMNFNSNNSTVDQLTTLDGLGRVHVQQTRQGPYASNSNFDSVETDYDSIGRVSRVTMPYSGTAGQTNSSAPSTTTTYDALSRVHQVTDGGGGTATYTPSQTSSDVLVAVGPAPSGENTKQRQFEYNSLGWLTSVCEITTILPGNGSCAQNTSQTGYWTKYTFDALGDLLTVTQNAQASSGSQQSRTFAYDAMGRLTSETNPEMNQAAISYTYDSISSGTCAGTYSGDLLKRVDAIGNITCYTYDSLHRPLSTTYSVTGPTVSTPNKCFVYDAAIDGNSVNYVKTRLAEAYTTPSACSQTTLPSNTTDVAFSYSTRGEVTDVYEKTPHSGGTGAPYNHTTASFWASGALNTLGGPVIPTLTYAVDPESRPTTVSASGTNPVTSTTYNPYTNPPQQAVTFGSGDSDTFNFDPNTFRLTKYQFKVGTQTVTGAVNWNANGSLGSLNITDPFSSANTQNCNYTADDLARISKGDCGTIWGQTFGYDAFGNIQKNAISGEGGTTFAPCYQSSPSITNHISLVGGTGSNCSGGTAPTYDANGNSLNDTFRTFTWDAENRPVTIGSVSLTYDALGRMAEQSVSGTNTEIVYSPSGGKLSLMNGISLIKAFAPLTAGATAIYTSGTGPAYYRHTDHLGSSRFASTPSQTLYSDTAYSAFGEPYASSGTIDNSFTGQNQDTLAGLYDFLAREQDPNQGRWTQPDPAGLAVVDPTNPQSWNRYSYVLNNPLSLVDAAGLNECAPDEHSCWWDDGEGGPGVDLFGGSPGDPLGCAWADFWGGDCAIENRMASNVLGNIGQIELQFLLDSLDTPINAFTGSDCNGGPCYPFSYYIGNGCFAYVSYQTVSDVGGEYDMPSIGIACAGSQGGGGRSGGGGGGDAAKALARAINATGVQTIANPCFVPAFYLTSAVGGAIGVGAANAPAAVAYASENYPTLIHGGLTWLLRLSPLATGRISGTIALIKAAPGKINAACSQLN